MSVFIKMSFLSLSLLLAMPLIASAQHNCANCPYQSVHKAAADTTTPKAEPVYKELPGQGKKVQLDDKSYFIYKFDKKPKMGTAILKVQIFDQKGKKDTTLTVTGHYGMPSMKGAHDASADFKLNKKGNYVMPVNVVMPGEWEIKLDFKQKEKIIYRGSFKFGV
jgi:hypothetical protein